MSTLPTHGTTGKIGRNPSGSQRYLCKVCPREYTPQPNAAGYADEVRRKALVLYVDGLNFRCIGLVLDISHQTVANWVKAHADRLPDEPPVSDGDVEVEELDELFTFFERKKTPPTS